MLSVIGFIVVSILVIRGLAAFIQDIRKLMK